MANYSLTASPLDSLVGADTAADMFVVAGPGRLVGTDTVQGGGGAFSDLLRITASITLPSAAFANTRGIERLQITAATGAAVTLDDAMVSSGALPAFYVFGLLGGDTVIGSEVVSTPLVMSGDAGDDWLAGGGGADSIAPGLGAETVDGGGGNDTVDMAFSALTSQDRLDGGAGNDDLLRLTGGAGNLSAAIFAGLAGFERIEIDSATIAALTVTVAAGYATGGGALSVAAALGNDTLRGADAAVQLVFLGGGGHDRLLGGAFGDTLVGDAGNDSLFGEGGNDRLDGGEGNDRISGGTGNDVLIGGAGNDTISAGTGNDTIEAGAGTDRIDGGAGNDLYRFAAGEFDLTDLIADEAGSQDAVEFAGDLALSITATASNRLLGIERLQLGGGNDVFVPSQALADGAGGGAMTVDGGAGNDRIDVSAITWLIEPLRWRLIGGDGADTLAGGAGADTIEAGAGGGTAQGGSGDDLFVLAVDDFLSLPVLDAGTGNADVLRIAGEGVLNALAFGAKTGFEIIEMPNERLQISLLHAMIAATSSSSIDFLVRGGTSDDTIIASGLNVGTDLAVELGGGDDSFIGGAGDETVAAGAGIDTIQLGTGFDVAVFGVNELSALDTVGADTVSGDTLRIDVASGRTLASNSFAGVSGIDTVQLDAPLGPAGVRLPGNLVTQSGQSTVAVDVVAITHGMVVDGRAVASGAVAVTYSGGAGDDLIFAGGGADTLSGSGGEDTLVGGDGGDVINLGAGGTERDLALIVSALDGTSDINTTQSVSTADRVTGLDYEGNYIAVDPDRLGLPGGSTLFLNAGDDISFGWTANVLFTTNEIAGNNFGSLAAVAAVVGNRLTGGTAGVQDRIVLVIGGADETEFGVYLFVDRDDNSTINSADLLYLLAIGDTDVPGFNSGRGFTLHTLDVL